MAVVGASRRGLRAGLLLLAAAVAPAAVPAQMLAAIPLEAASVPVRPAGGLHVRVHAADGAGLARWLGRPEGRDGQPGAVDLVLRPGTHPELNAPADATAASFIVDFDDPAVVRLSRQLAGEAGAAPIDGARIVAFVAKLMRPDYAAHAQLASEVARRLEGDCTEHSLLTAALARSARIPARIVQGAALVHADGRWQAYGHAWVQMQEAGRWTVRDSALAGWSGPVYYVPAFVFADEGPGYKLGVLQNIGRMPRRIEILGTADTAPAR